MTYTQKKITSYYASLIGWSVLLFASYHIVRFLIQVGIAYFFNGHGVYLR